MSKDKTHDFDIKDVVKIKGASRSNETYVVVGYGSDGGMVNGEKYKIEYVMIQSKKGNVSSVDPSTLELIKQ